MNCSIRVAVSTVVPCLVLAALPAFAQGDAALIERNEAAAIADLKTIMSAEAAYQALNGGLYDSLACLQQPSACIPGYPVQAPTFLDAAISSLTVEHGYRRAFFTKPLGQKPGPGSSPTSAVFFAATLWPDKPGKTGQRAFCGDAEGLICFTKDGKAPKIGLDGRCPSEAKDGKPAQCEVLR